MIAIADTNLEALDRAEAAARLIDVEVEPEAVTLRLFSPRPLPRAARGGEERAATGSRASTGAPAAGDLILRHDVDLSLEAAVALAEVEAEAGAWSTWFLMTRSVFYNLDSAEGERAIARLRELGGRIAHHAVWPDVDLDDRFERVVAWHNPDPEYMTAPIEGAMNVMSAAVVRPGALPLGLEPALAPRLPARRRSRAASSSGSSS